MIESGLVLSFPRIEKNNGFVTARASILNPEFNRGDCRAELFAVRQGRTVAGKLVNQATVVSLFHSDPNDIEQVTSADGEEFPMGKRLAVVSIVSPTIRSALQQGAHLIAKDLGINNCLL